MDLCVLSNIGCEEREKEKTSQCNKGQSSSQQQETQESVLHQIEKIIFQDHEAASDSKKLLLNQENHEKKQSR